MPKIPETVISFKGKETITKALDLAKGGIKLFAPYMILQMQSVQNAVNKSLNSIAVAAAAVSVAFGGIIEVSKQTAARTQVLGTVMNQVALQTHNSAASLDKYVKSIRDAGITAQEARTATIRFMQAELDLSKATELANTARDLAVIGGENTSETYGKLIDTISSLNTMMLNQYGLTKNLSQILSEYAAKTGLTVDKMTEAQAKTAMLNYILTEGKKVAGAYGAAMEDVGKKATSLARYYEELRNAIGEPFLKAWGVWIDLQTKAVKGFTDFFEKYPIAATFMGIASAIGAATAALIGFVNSQGGILKIILNLIDIGFYVFLVTGAFKLLSGFLSGAFSGAVIKAFVTFIGFIDATIAKMAQLNILTGVQVVELTALTAKAELGFLSNIAPKLGSIGGTSLGKAAQEGVLAQKLLSDGWKGVQKAGKLAGEVIVQGLKSVVSFIKTTAIPAIANFAKMFITWFMGIPALLTLFLVGVGSVLLGLYNLTQETKRWKEETKKVRQEEEQLAKSAEASAKKIQEISGGGVKSARETAQLLVAQGIQRKEIINLIEVEKNKVGEVKNRYNTLAKEFEKLGGMTELRLITKARTGPGFETITEEAYQRMQKTNRELAQSQKYYDAHLQSWKDILNQITLVEKRLEGLPAYLKNIEKLTKAIQRGFAYESITLGVNIEKFEGGIIQIHTGLSKLRVEGKLTMDMYRALAQETNNVAQTNGMSAESIAYLNKLLIDTKTLTPEITGGLKDLDSALLKVNAGYISSKRALEMWKQSLEAQLAVIGVAKPEVTEALKAQLFEVYDKIEQLDNEESNRQKQEAEKSKSLWRDLQEARYQSWLRYYDRTINQEGISAKTRFQLFDQLYAKRILYLQEELRKAEGLDVTSKKILTIRVNGEIAELNKKRSDLYIQTLKEEETYYKYSLETRLSATYNWINTLQGLIGGFTTTQTTNLELLKQAMKDTVSIDFNKLLETVQNLPEDTKLSELAFQRLNVAINQAKKSGDPSSLLKSLKSLTQAQQEHLQPIIKQLELYGKLFISNEKINNIMKEVGKTGEITLKQELDLYTEINKELDKLAVKDADWRKQKLENAKRVTDVETRIISKTLSEYMEMYDKLAMWAEGNLKLQIAALQKIKDAKEWGAQNELALEKRLLQMKEQLQKSYYDLTMDYQDKIFKRKYGDAAVELLQMERQHEKLKDFYNKDYKAEEEYQEGIKELKEKYKQEQEQKRQQAESEGKYIPMFGVSPDEILQKAKQQIDTAREYGKELWKIDTSSLEDMLNRFLPKLEEAITKAIGGDMNLNIQKQAPIQNIQINIEGNKMVSAGGGLSQTTKDLFAKAAVAAVSDVGRMSKTTGAM